MGKKRGATREEVQAEMNRMQGRCMNCRFLEIHYEAEFDEHGQFDLSGSCRRHAPRPAILNEDDDIATSIAGHVTLWPWVRHSDWCAEFEEAGRTPDPFLYK